LSKDIVVMNQNIVYLGQLNLEEMIRKIEEVVVRMLKIITENNTKILKL